MKKYGLGPDKLIAKNFRRIRSSLPGYQPFGKSDWITEIKEIYSRKPNASSRWLQLNHSNLHHQGTWLFGDWDSALRAAGFDPEEKRIEKVWSADRVIREILDYELQSSRCMRVTHCGTIGVFSRPGYATMAPGVGRCARPEWAMRG